VDKQDLIKAISACGISAVFRTDDTAGLIPAAAAFVAGGVPVVEFTMTIPNCLGLLEQAAHDLPKEALLGAGTVLDAATARSAILAGAQYIVSPVLDAEVVDICHRYGVLAIPGVLTPNEIMQAVRLGVEMIKVFPACALGPTGFTELLGPFPGLRLVAAAVGGLDHVASYIRAGAQVVCVPGQGVDACAYAERRFDAITQAARGLTATVKAARETRRD
jgi:2-dehydro-3-deoxyphosphogluconate aldolase / (4S)-4-hydroxy-2-oxoglutarate aldolase